MTELWDLLPAWLQQVIAALGWILWLLGRFWNRLPARLSVFNSLFVAKGEEEGFIRWRSWTIVAWGTLSDAGVTAEESEERRHLFPARDPTHRQDQQPQQPDKRQEQQASDRGTDDPPDKAA